MGTYDLQTNDKLESDGVELDLGDKGVFIIARAGGGNKIFLKEQEKIARKHRKTIEHMGVEDLNVMLKKLYARTVVKGWRNVTGPDGEPLEFSELNCLKLFDDINDLFLIIKETAEEAAIFRAKIEEAEAGN